MDAKAVETEKQSVELMISGESLRLRVDPAEAAGLRRAAAYLEEKVQSYNRAGVGISGLRAVILAGLDVTHESFQAKTKAKEADDKLRGQDNDLQRLIEKIDASIDSK